MWEVRRPVNVQHDRHQTHDNLLLCSHTSNYKVKRKNNVNEVKGVFDRDIFQAATITVQFALTNSFVGTLTRELENKLVKVYEKKNVELM